MNYSRPAADPVWTQLLNLVEQLVDHSTPTAQCNLIEETISQLLSAQVKVWLASPNYPLPGLPAVETLPEVSATPLAHQALAKGEIQIGRPQPAQDAAPAEAGPCAVAIPIKVKQEILG